MSEEQDREEVQKVSEHPAQVEESPVPPTDAVPRGTDSADGEAEPAPAGEMSAADSASDSGEAQETAEQEEGLNPKLASQLLPEEDTDYEALFMKDARQRAHDAELAALASLALIRSNRDERDQLVFNLEREFGIDTGMVNRHMRDLDRNKAAALLSDIDQIINGEKGGRGGR